MTNNTHRFGWWRKKILDECGIKEFHYITHISNLSSIYKYGKIFSRNEALEKIEEGFEDWSNQRVQEHREKEIRISNKSIINGHDLVPLFFNSNNPTLYAKPVKDNWGKLAVLSIGSTIVYDKDVETAFCNGNFARQDSTLHYDLRKLNTLDWEIIFGGDEIKKLPSQDGYENYKTKRSSEFFIYPSIKKRWIKKVYVSSEDSLSKVSNILEGRVANVFINKEIFKD